MLLRFPLRRVPILCFSPPSSSVCGSSVGLKFPGTGTLGPSFKMTEEWYSLKNFADDLHVLLVNETNGMHDKCYDRPPYPATWIRNYGQGRVFYTSMGHRQEVWASPQFQNLIAGAISWAVRDSNADTTPNIERVVPQANVIPPK
jgi:type 1 glutamine amidotransferase